MGTVQPSADGNLGNARVACQAGRVGTALGHGVRKPRSEIRKKEEEKEEGASFLSSRRALR
ncbi:hypothetical protein SDC9_127065 [bioreactor metagenome]|uniref:Uncharacterized protein n=1 Tax=bioreactor metagenome TaxID=1076179 RepID=A0A645CTJ1_9ZZZZ